MLVHDRHVWRLIWGTIIGLVILIALCWSYMPLQDPVSYFNFADQRMFLGIPNFFDVTSNLFFIYVGIWGMLNTFSWLWLRRPKSMMVALFFVNLSVFLTGWGSSYFHMMPNGITLFWDRAPMAMGFVALLVLILSERAPSYVWQVFLVPMIGVGVYSAWVASFQNDIRFYVAVQAGALLATVILLVFRRAVFLNNKLLYTAFGFYFVAKILEHYDHAVFEFCAFSGHTLKHIVAAVAILLINLAIQVKVKRHF